MHLIPMNDRVMVRRDEPEYPGCGIILPDRAKEKPCRGTVLAVGDGRKLDSGIRADFPFSIGDRVVFNAYAGEEFKIDGEPILLMKEGDVMAVLV